MKKIYEQLPIELWVNLAYKTRYLAFSEKTEKEFYNNLKKLVKLLSNTEIDLTTGSRSVVNKEEIGLAILLHTVYQIETKDNCSKGLTFYKTIRQLLKMGIKSIEFLPVEFYKETTLEQTINNGKIESLSKTFTDGEFEFYRYGKNCENIKIGNLRDANYILRYDMQRDENDELIIVDAKASLKTFNGILPSKKEIAKESFPELDAASLRYFFEKNQFFSRQIFSKCDEYKYSYKK